MTYAYVIGGLIVLFLIVWGIERLVVSAKAQKVAKEAQVDVKKADADVKTEIKKVEADVTADVKKVETEIKKI